MTFIVHGATGAQGSPVLSALRTAGHEATAAVRNTSAVDGAAVEVDFASVESLTAAYTGAAGVFVHLPVGDPAQQIAAATHVAAALKQAGVPRVVFSTSGFPTTPGTGAAALIDALEGSSTSLAVIEPRLFLENLLLPPVVGPARSEGVLRYPVRADYPLSWVSHLDVADLASALLTDTSITGSVSVGALPPLLGADLAAGFSDHLGTTVVFEAQDPEAFGEAIIPMFGEQAARPVIDSYVWRQTQPDDVIDEGTSAQKLLGLTPRTVSVWLSDLGV